MLASFGPFTGTIPRRAPRFLPEGAAQKAENCKLYSGEVRPYSGPIFKNSPVNGSATRRAYRYVNSGAEYWFNWANYVDIVLGPLSKDTLNRRFYTGDGAPKKTGNDIGIPAASNQALPAAWYWLGVILPAEIPTVGTQSGGSTPDETINYIFTYVTGWGEEGGPSLPSADFTAHINRTSVVFTRPVPSITFIDGNVSTATDQVNIASWQGDTAATIHAYARVQLTTSGTLPAGLALATDYWIVPIDSSHFGFATSFANALAGVLVDITAASGGGTHTIKQYTPDARYNIVSINIYRSNTGTDGAAFQFVANLAVNTGTTITYTDAITDAALGTAIDDTVLDYAEPPTDMVSLHALPNGMLCGVSPSLQKVCFSVPNVPHAWPDTVDYRRTMPFPPRACGAVGTTVIVATDGKPYIFTGVAPGAITGSALDAEQSILNARSLVETPVGVIWASPDGLYMVGPGGSQLLTSQQFSKDEWKTLNPASMVCAVYDGRVYVAYDATNSGNYNILVFDPNEPEALCTTIAENTQVLQPDILADALYMLINGQIVQWDADQLNPLTWTYRTAIRRDQFPNNKSALQIVSDFGGGVLANGQSLATYNAARLWLIGFDAALTVFNAAYAQISAYNNFPEAYGGDGYGESGYAGTRFMDIPASITFQLTVRLYGDGVLRYTAMVDSQDPVRLPGGYRCREWELEISANCRLSYAKLANSFREITGA